MSAQVDHCTAAAGNRIIEMRRKPVAQRTIMRLANAYIIECAQLAIARGLKGKLRAGFAEMREGYGGKEWHKNDSHDCRARQRQ